MANEFKNKIKAQLLEAAQDYSKLITRAIVLESNEFVFQKRYVLKFNRANFLHLTGVYSTVKANAFFEKCFDGTISVDDFEINNKKNKSTIKKKIKNLVDLSVSFDSEVLVQEMFVKNRVICKIATSDDKRTIGFVDGRYCVWPNTLLDKNHLDTNKAIVKVKPIIFVVNSKE